MTKAVYIQDSDFDNLLTSSGLVVVDYTASWCGPCKLISPFIDELAEKYEGRAKVVKVDLDHNKENAKKYNIKSIPAVLIFKDGEEVERLVGKASYETFSQALEKYL
ncbi:thioredoxin [Brasilonema octagenarum UFV-E1]|uniref:Thioredoxin n=2 Tax=Brasilonema TaxID=383614 RepID=A0A856MHY0_9CYAN|nr:MULTISPECIES: thioredoxin [Brasilonema]NMF67241.1 thioredoxin [Brasilonema octagenarum UFV-OR1]QDL10853.1 thioredoxin [Brasilonema sennae CENA114]QDL17198.1 thioredoxin [Brasilonema octagenarum UFV-E1]